MRRCEKCFWTDARTARFTLYSVTTVYRVAISDVLTSRSLNVDSPYRSISCRYLAYHRWAYSNSSLARLLRSEPRQLAQPTPQLSFSTLGGEYGHLFSCFSLPLLSICHLWCRWLHFGRTSIWFSLRCLEVQLCVILHYCGHYSIYCSWFLHRLRCSYFHILSIMFLPLYYSYIC